MPASSYKVWLQSWWRGSLPTHSLSSSSATGWPPGQKEVMIHKQQGALHHQDPLPPLPGASSHPPPPGVSPGPGWAEASPRHPGSSLCTVPGPSLFHPSPAVWSLSVQFAQLLGSPLLNGGLDNEFLKAAVKCVRPQCPSQETMLMSEAKPPLSPGAWPPRGGQPPPPRSWRPCGELCVCPHS